MNSFIMNILEIDLDIYDFKTKEHDLDNLIKEKYLEVLYDWDNHNSNDNIEYSFTKAVDNYKKKSFNWRQSPEFPSFLVEQYFEKEQIQLSENYALAFIMKEIWELLCLDKAKIGLMFRYFDKIVKNY